MTQLTMSMFANKEDYEKAKAEQEEARQSCPMAGKQYCEYPFCNCKDEVENPGDIGC